MGSAWRERCAQTITLLGNCCMNNLQSFDHNCFSMISCIQHAHRATVHGLHTYTAVLTGRPCMDYIHAYAAVLIERPCMDYIHAAVLTGRPCMDYIHAYAAVLMERPCMDYICIQQCSQSDHAWITNSSAHRATMHGLHTAVLMERPCSDHTCMDYIQHAHRATMS